MVVKIVVLELVVGSCEKDDTKPETNRETSVIIPLLITVLFQIKTLVTYVK